MLNKGDTVYINGKPYILGDKLGEGVQGNVYNVENLPKYVIKLIHNTSSNNESDADIRKRIQWLITEIGKTDLKQKLTLPKALLDDYLGYIMLKAYEHDSLNKYLTIGDIDAKTWLLKEYKLKKRYQIIVSIFQSLREIHLKGLIFTDLSPNNIFVHKEENQIVFIDTDNLRRRNDRLLSVLGTPGYMAPEIYHKVDLSIIQKHNVPASIFSKSGVISTDSDIFSAAIIAFQLITMQHPFIGDEIEDGSAELEESALRCETDYIFCNETSNKSTSMLSPYFNELSTEVIRELFKQTFVSGKISPKDRPTDLEFLEVFQKGLDLIVSCPICGFDNLEQTHEEYKCSYCKNNIEPHTTMIVYMEFKNTNLESIANGFIGEEVLVNNQNSEPIFRKELSRVVLENNVAKSLYLHHFEENVNRSEKYAQVKITENLDVDFIINTKYFTNAKLISLSNNSVIPLDKSKSFKLNEYKILLDMKTSLVNNFSIFIEFIR